MFALEKINVDKDLIINTIMNNSQDTIYIKDKDSAIIWSSKAHSLLWGVEDPAQVVGKTDFDYFPYDFAEIAYGEEQKIINTGVPIVRRVERLVMPDGEIMWISSSKYPFYNAEGEIVGTWGTSRDITDLKKTEEKLRLVNLELKEANRQLSILSAKDSLSGLYNHRCFYKELEITFDFYKNQKEENFSKDFALILLDIDNFKVVNDTYGHLVGDIAIKHLAEIMLRNISHKNSCFRYGGDEFAILLQDIDINKALEVAKELQNIIVETPVDYKDTGLAISVSMGVAAFSDAIDPEDLVNQADEKLYLSKKSGRNRIT